MKRSKKGEEVKEGERRDEGSNEGGQGMRREGKQGREVGREGRGNESDEGGYEMWGKEEGKGEKRKRSIS